MTASTLSPAEQDEVTRFGIHDEEQLRDLEDHLGDEVSCLMECGRAASAVLVMRCCGASGPHCQPCIDAKKFNLPAFFSRCLHCGWTGFMCSFDDVFRVVPL